MRACRARMGTSMPCISVAAPVSYARQPARCGQPPSEGDNRMLFILSVLLAIGAFVIWRTASKRRGGRTTGARGSWAASRGSARSSSRLLALAQCSLSFRPAMWASSTSSASCRIERSPPASISSTPSRKVKKFSIQTQEIKETMQVLSREGLTIGLEISALYRLNPDSAARMYQDGPERRLREHRADPAVPLHQPVRDGELPGQRALFLRPRTAGRRRSRPSWPRRSRRAA